MANTHHLPAAGSLARACSRHARWVLIAWFALVGALNLAVPQLERTVAEHSAPFTPESATTATLREMSRDFGVPDSTAVGAVVLSADRVLGPADVDYYHRLVQRLADDDEDVAYVLDLFGNPGLDKLGLSPDGQAIELLIATTGDVGSSRAHQSTQRVRDLIAELPRPDGLVVNLTGPSPTFSDLFAAIDTSLVIITMVSVALITLLLVVVYRSLITALIPLLTVGTSLGVARPVISLLGGTEMLPVSNFTIALATAMVLGAGTDYGIFLLANYHEGRRRGVAVEAAVADSGARTAAIVIASALTIAGAGMAMVFTKIGMFRTAGPPIAVAIAITAAVSLTLTPALIAVWGRRGRAEPRPLDERAWRRRGARIVRRAPALAAGTLVFLLATSSALMTFRPNMDENAMQLRATDSKRGYQAVQRHWGRDEVDPEFVVIRADHDMRNTADLAALDLIAGGVAGLPGLPTCVRLTGPAAHPLAQTAIGFQTGQVAEGLTDAGHRIDDQLPQLRRLAAGVTELRDGTATAQRRLPALTRGVDDVTGLARTLLTTLGSADRLLESLSGGAFDVAATVATLTTATSALETVAAEITAGQDAVGDATAGLHAVFDPLTAVAPGPQCAADPHCLRARRAFVEARKSTDGRVLAAVTGAQALAPVVPDDVVAAAVAEIGRTHV